MTTTKTPDYAAKIAALLTKAEDPAATPAEAESYTIKAEALMIKWGISDAELDSRRRGRNKREDIVEVKLPFTGLHAQARARLVWNVANGLGLRSLKSARSNGDQVSYLIGHQSDVDRAITLFNSLVVQQDAALEAWWKGEDSPRRYLSQYDGRKARRQFQVSFGDAVDARLRRTRRAAEQETKGTGTDLVLVDRKAAVDSWLGEKYPKLGTARGISGSAFGRVAGREAGQRANLGTTAVGGVKGELA